MAPTVTCRNWYLLLFGVPSLVKAPWTLVTCVKIERNKQFPAMYFSG
jgi:hypothetical protein